MAPIDRFMRPIQRAVVAFFRHDLKLKRSRDGLAVVLTERSPAPSRRGGKRRDDGQAEREREERRQMLAELEVLLDEQPGSRQTLRHLVFVHQALTKKGLKALHKIPLDVLQRALVQFESLVTNWTPVGLANLRSKMAVAIIDRERSDPDPDADAEAYRSEAVLEAGLDGPPPLPEVVSGDEETLAAAYAALGAAGGGPDAAAVADSRSVPLEYQPELGSPSARAVAPPLTRPTVRSGEIELRVLQD